MSESIPAFRDTQMLYDAEAKGYIQDDPRVGVCCFHGYLNPMRCAQCCGDDDDA